MPLLSIKLKNKNKSNNIHLYMSMRIRVMENPMNKKQFDIAWANEYHNDIHETKVEGCYYCSLIDDNYLEYLEESK